MNLRQQTKFLEIRDSYFQKKCWIIFSEMAIYAGMKFDIWSSTVIHSKFV